MSVAFPTIAWIKVAEGCVVRLLHREKAPDALFRRRVVAKEKRDAQGGTREPLFAAADLGESRGETRGVPGQERRFKVGLGLSLPRKCQLQKTDRQRRRGQQKEWKDRQRRGGNRAQKEIEKQEEKRETGEKAGQLAGDHGEPHQGEIVIFQMDDLVGEDARKFAPRELASEAFGKDDCRLVLASECECGGKAGGDGIEERRFCEIRTSADLQKHVVKSGRLLGRERARADGAKEKVRRGVPSKKEHRRAREDACRDPFPPREEPAAIGKKKRHRCEQQKGVPAGAVKATPRFFAVEARVVHVAIYCERHAARRGKIEIALPDDASDPGGRAVFADRREAGRQLLERLRHLEPEKPLVLALPRGGVAIGFEIAQGLDAPLDIVLVGKIGVPWQRELALGAVADGADPEIVIDENLRAELAIDERYIEEETKRQLAEIDRRRRLYRGDRPALAVAGRTVVLVDDGIATGSTLFAALRSLRKVGAGKIVLAVPVAPQDALDKLRPEVDVLLCLSSPEPFFAVGAHYRDFAQVSDEEVVALLEARQGRPPDSLPEDAAP